ncbi:hypothetical protein GCHA_0486 [Paraglaciecola chathamensis S18K6]|uniref:Transposase n=1 Tax=Paraglaciecola chathamensis S18K6 TaxID=1127672 RepID=A0AAV3UTJ0_9ALTE|nr:hypothetical protein GCHA_0486 [Paraglaciecola chathamensis S18K6]
MSTNSITLAKVLKGCVQPLRAPHYSDLHDTRKRFFAL